MATNVIHEVKNRQTGTLIKIVQVTNPKDGYGWGAQCSDHGSQIKVNTRRQAHEAGRTPAAWCHTCKGGAKKTTAKAPAKKVAAKKTAKRASAKKATASKR